MIRNRLAELLAERNLKISRVANDLPNISRNTITSVAQDNGKMIQLETINSLCQYLNVTPSDFFEFLPFDISFSSVWGDDNKLKIETVKDNSYDPGIGSLKIIGLDLDGFLSQSYIRQSTGEQKRTFQISIEQTDELHIDVDSDRYDWTGDLLLSNDSQTNLNFAVTLDRTSELKDFLKLWDNDLTIGFKNRIENQIKQSIKDTVATNFANIVNNNPELSANNQLIIDMLKEIKFSIKFFFDDELRPNLISLDHSIIFGS